MTCASRPAWIALPWPGAGLCLLLRLWPGLSNKDNDPMPMSELPVNWRLSKSVARTVKATKLECWCNAWRALQRCPELKVGLYVEGWLALLESELVIEHGWIEMPNCIVEPTLEEECEVVYFPGRKWTREEARIEAGKPGPFRWLSELPLSWRRSWGGWDDPNYRGAAFEAWAYLTRRHSEMADQLGGVNPSNSTCFFCRN